MGVLKRTFSITKASFRALWANPRLLIFPALSGIAMLLIVASFIAPLAIALSGNAGDLPVWLASIIDRLGSLRGDGLTISPLGYLAMFAFYFVLYFVAIFFNVAMTREALKSLRGEPTSVLAGLGFALSRLPAILGFTAIASTVGVLLQAIHERVGLFGQIATSFLGLAWSLITFLVFPVMAQEKRGGLASIKRSAALFKRTWGESALGDLGIALLFLPAVALISGLIALAVSLGGTAAVLLVFVGVPASLFATMIFVAALRTMYRAALYVYAAEGVVVDHFQVPALETVWTVRATEPNGS